jgi:hypothetical protein
VGGRREGGDVDDGRSERGGGRSDESGHCRILPKNSGEGEMEADGGERGEERERERETERKRNSDESIWLVSEVESPTWPKMRRWSTVAASCDWSTGAVQSSTPPNGRSKH